MIDDAWAYEDPWDGPFDGWSPEYATENEDDDYREEHDDTNDF